MAQDKSERVLPRGPHSLSREEVENSQRRRLIASMMHVVGERGYTKTSVAEIIKRAGVSRATFYMLFKDKEQCFIQGLESAIDEIGAAMALTLMEADDIEEDGDVMYKVDTFTRIYLQVLSSQPAVAKTFLVEIYAVGPRAVEQRLKFMERFIDLVVTMILDGRKLSDEQRFALEAILHSMSSMVTLAIGSGNGERLMDIREPFVNFVGELLASELFEDVFQPDSA